MATAERLEVTRGRAQLQAGASVDVGDRAGGEFRMRVDSGTDSGAAERDFLERLPRFRRPLAIALDHTRVAHEFLPEPDRCGILKMGPPHFDDTVELASLLSKSLA